MNAREQRGLRASSAQHRGTRRAFPQRIRACPPGKLAYLPNLLYKLKL